ncbi:MAG: Rid family hydrolase, partial [Pseudomonadota bacterium]
MTHRRIFDGTEAAGGYARAVKAGNMVFVAGTTSLTREGAVAGADMYAQSVITFDKIEAALREAGADLSHVVRLTCYVTSLDDAGGFTRALR